jgi:putative methyltransferase (TIGR04325 family)
LTHRSRRSTDDALAFDAERWENSPVPKRNSLKAVLHVLLPPTAVRRMRRFRLRRVFTGDYRTWASARMASDGYDDQAVLQKVRAATREVVAGRALWERDGIAFNSPEVNEPLLTALREIAAREGNRLELIDFGGALGSTWRQHRAALGGLVAVRWRVVEQPHFVEAGREFADEILSFHTTLRDALAAGAASTVLYSGVLPYLEQPTATLHEAADLGIRHILLDRTSCAIDGRERIAVQRPPAKLGGAYPCWLFNRDRLISPLRSHYELRQEWTSFDDYPGVDFRGFHFQRQR